MSNIPTNLRSIDALLYIMRRLRDPETGCPWDVEQTFRSIATYTIEEAYEVADAIERNNLSDLKDELGDLLFQSVFHAQMAAEKDEFDFADVVEAICEKMLRRHPHVFGDAEQRSAGAQEGAWEAQKAAERAEKARGGVLDDIPASLPAVTRALKIQKRMARVGFDWAKPKDILPKIIEEAGEIIDATEAGDHENIEEEFGDLLFVIMNLSRKLKVDPEAALRQANRKAERRFRYIETQITEAGGSLEAASLEEMDTLWNEAKSLEKGG